MNKRQRHKQCKLMFGKKERKLDALRNRKLWRVKPPYPYIEFDYTEGVSPIAQYIRTWMKVIDENKNRSDKR